MPRVPHPLRLLPREQDVSLQNRVDELRLERRVAPQRMLERGERRDAHIHVHVLFARQGALSRYGQGW